MVGADTRAVTKAFKNRRRYYLMLPFGYLGIGKPTQEADYLGRYEREGLTSRYCMLLR